MLSVLKVVAPPAIPAATPRCPLRRSRRRGGLCGAAVVCHRAAPRPLKEAGAQVRPPVAVVVAGVVPPAVPVTVSIVVTAVPVGPFSITVSVRSRSRFDHRVL